MYRTIASSGDGQYIAGYRTIASSGDGQYIATVGAKNNFPLRFGSSYVFFSERNRWGSVSDWFSKRSSKMHRPSKTHNPFRLIVT